jgi:predicted transcriptional regulator
MKLSALFNATQAEVLWTGSESDPTEVRHVISSDLMSDVLMMDLEHPLLLTSLVSDQSLRTAHVVEAAAVLIANGKTPPLQMIQLAAELKIPLARTELPKFDAAVALGKALA